jgi:hypothetical protein
VPAAPVAAPWEEQCLRGSAAEEAFAFGVGQAEPERTRTLAIERPERRPALAGVGGEPGDESLQRLPVEFSEAHVR